MLYPHKLCTATRVASQRLGGRRGMLTRSCSTFGNDHETTQKDDEAIIPNPPTWFLEWGEVTLNQMNQLMFAKIPSVEKSSTLLYMHLAKVLFGTKPTNCNCWSQKSAKTVGISQSLPRRQRWEPIKIHSSQPMSSQATMLPSIHKEAIGGRSDGSATHGALAKLLTTMTISTNHMATWNQSHSRPMLLTNGASRAEASSGLGRGFCASGILRAPLHCHSENPAILECGFHRAPCKAQLHEKFQQPLSHHLLLRSTAVLRGHGIIYATRATSTSRNLFTLLHELVLDVSKPSLVRIHWVPCQLLTEWHYEERRIRRMAFKAQTRGAWLLVAKCFGRNNSSEIIESYLHPLQLHANSIMCKA